jgi:hypothetical protein
MNVAVKKGDAEQVQVDLKGLFETKGIACVLFIDDAFEPISNFEPTETEAAEIWAQIQEDDALLAEASAHGISSQDHVTADGVAAARNNADGKLQQVLDDSSYVIGHQSKLDRLKPVVDHLGQLGLEVRTAGRDEWEDRLEGVDIVFLDWFLGVDGRQEAIDRASSAARKIHASERKPLIVLISSDPSVKSNSQVFREASGLIAGLFDAMPKEWLADEYGIHLQMTALAELFQKGHVVQAFVDNIQKQTASAVLTFRETISQLTLSDYANLQHFALKKDGHPLGDYLMNLLSGLWSDALFRGDLKKSLLDLDHEDFTSLPAITAPTSAFARVYNSAVFDMHVGDFEPHPHDTAKGTADPDLHLSLGDLIVEEEAGKPKSVYIIMNPECDLAYSPKGTRKIAADQTILLLPGDLVAVDHADRTVRRSLPDTPFFVLDDKAKFRIHWKISALFSVEYKGFKEWLGAKKRRAAMRPLYILSLQQAVHAHLTRVGLPSPPPVYEELTATAKPLFGQKFLDGEVASQQGKYVMARDTDDDQVAFTSEFIVKIKELLVRGLAKYEISGVAKDQEYKAAIEASMKLPGEWAQLLKPFKLSKAGAKFFSDALIVCREDKAPTEQQLSRKNLVCVLLR